MMSVLPAVRRFRNLGLMTIFVVYTLILVGGVVRASGSGMGCPDWPMCFGRWIPPTSEAQLPADYQQIYADRGYLETKFNVRKTWTEYANRLLGASTGFLIFLTLIFSTCYLKTDKAVFRLSLAAFLLVGFQGWLGSRVVASNLTPGLITVHMITAQIIVGLLIVALVRSKRDVLQQLNITGLPSGFRKVLIAAMAMILLQMTMGTQVREAIDIISHQFDYIDRHLWIENLPIIFLVHRSFSSIILFTNLWLVWQMYKCSRHEPALKLPSIGLAGLVIGVILLGVAMDRLNVPAAAQPLHMWFASLIFGCQLYLFLLTRYAAK